MHSYYVYCVLGIVYCVLGIGDFGRFGPGRNPSCPLHRGVYRPANQLSGRLQPHQPAFLTTRRRPVAGECVPLAPPSSFPPPHCGRCHLALYRFFLFVLFLFFFVLFFFFFVVLFCFLCVFCVSSFALSLYHWYTFAVPLVHFCLKQYCIVLCCMVSCIGYCVFGIVYCVLVSCIACCVLCIVNQVHVINASSLVYCVVPALRIG